MDVRIAITRAGIFLLVYTLVLGLPFWFGFATGEWILALILMGILASVGPIMYHLLHQKAENILLAQQRRYQHILLQASAGMVKIHDLNKLLKVTTYIVRKAVKITFAACFLEDQETGGYRLKVLRNSKQIDAEMYFAPDHPLIQYLKNFKEPLTVEELPESSENSFSPELEARLIVPSFIDDRLLGFLVLGEKVNKTLYSQDDINVFQTLSNQAALAIENCRFMEEFRKTQERIFAAEKLASIGGLAEGVAHQIRNRLNHFSITAGEMQFEVKDFIKDHKELVEKNPDLKKSLAYLSEIGDSLSMNVKRTDGVINGILSYARVEANESYFSEFSVTTVIDLCLELLKVKHNIQTVPLKVDIRSSDMVYGIKSQLMETFYNVLDNAYEAIQDKIQYNKDTVETGFEPGITFKVTQQPDFTLVEVQDNGIGIKDEDRQKVFAPFFTTKSSYKSGTGIGMYVIKRMVEENHNGKVWFVSEHGRGTQFFIRLPRNKQVPRAAAQSADSPPPPMPS